MREVRAPCVALIHSAHLLRAQEGQKLKLTPWNEGCGEGVVVANAPKALTGTMNVAALERERLPMPASPSVF